MWSLPRWAFAGLYLVLGILFLYRVMQEICSRPRNRPLGDADGNGVWFAIVSAMLTVYVILDGFDFGAGILHRFVARTDEERRTVLAAIGPVWDGNEVWLMAAGGVLFMAFPRVYSAAFSGFYMALMIVLWLLILRGIAIESRSHQENPLWREFWDTTFSLSSALLALVLGAALGNVVRGVPLDATGSFAIPLFTDFQPGVHPGVFDWYTALVGAFTLCVLAGHGALLPCLEDNRSRAVSQPSLGPKGMAGRAASVGAGHPGHGLASADGFHEPPDSSLVARLCSLDVWGALGRLSFLETKARTGCLPVVECVPAGPHGCHDGGKLSGLAAIYSGPGSRPDGRECRLG